MPKPGKSAANQDSCSLSQEWESGEVTEAAARGQTAGGPPGRALVIAYDGHTVLRNESWRRTQFGHIPWTVIHGSRTSSGQPSTGGVRWPRRGQAGSIRTQDVQAGAHPGGLKASGVPQSRQGQQLSQTEVASTRAGPCAQHLSALPSSLLSGSRFRGGRGLQTPLPRARARSCSVGPAVGQPARTDISGL